MATFHTDLAIIGAGPAGLFAAFEAGRHGLSSRIIDVLDIPGGQCNKLYPEKPIYDIPGIPSCTGGDLTRNLLAQIERFNPAFHLGVQAVSLTRAKSSSGWIIALSDATEIHAKVVSIAAGAGSFTPRKLQVPEAEAFEGTSLFYAVENIEVLRGKRVVVVGGGDSAVDWALALQGVAKSVAIVHRRNVFKAAPESVAQLRTLVSEGKVSIDIGNVTELRGQGGWIRGVGVESPAGAAHLLACDALLVFFGLTSKLGPILNWGVNAERDRIPVNPISMETSIPGVFAIGDVADYPGKLRLILTGFSEASQMVQAAYRHITGEAPHFEYSTHAGNLRGDVRGNTMTPKSDETEHAPPPVPSNDEHVLVTDLEGRSHLVPARAGVTLLDLVSKKGLEIKASCYGACNCSTCHVYIGEDWVDKIPAMHEQEQEVLDQSACLRSTSRLACQITYQPELRGLSLALTEDTRMD